MNESTHKNPNGAGECQCHCDYTLAFLLLRGWLAVRGIFTGIEKFGAYRSIQKPVHLTFKGIIPGCPWG